LMQPPFCKQQLLRPIMRPRCESSISPGPATRSISCARNPS
jgi:hypothetical protein